jgi:hypothetical protein
MAGNETWFHAPALEPLSLLPPGAPIFLQLRGHFAIQPSQRSRILPQLWAQDSRASRRWSACILGCAPRISRGVLFGFGAPQQLQSRNPATVFGAGCSWLCDSVGFLRAGSMEGDSDYPYHPAETESLVTSLLRLSNIIEPVCSRRLYSPVSVGKVGGIHCRNLVSVWPHSA